MTKTKLFLRVVAVIVLCGGCLELFLGYDSASGVAFAVLGVEFAGEKRALKGGLWIFPLLSLCLALAILVLPRLSGAELGTVQSVVHHLGFVIVVCIVFLAGLLLVWKREKERAYV